MADNVIKFSNLASIWTLIASIICGTMYIASLEKRITIVEMKVDQVLTGMRNHENIS